MVLLALCALLSTQRAHGEGLVINELLADNKTGIRDFQGDYSDWLEFFNEGPGPRDLSGCYVTDDPSFLRKWRFPDSPDLVLQEGGYLVVFASGKNILDVDELHLNFSLAKQGEYVALTDADGVTVLHEIAPYPRQVADTSYGLAVRVDELVAAGMDVDYLVPSSGALGQTWTSRTFTPDGSWVRGARIGLGYATSGQAPAIPEPASLWSFDGTVDDAVGPNDGTFVGGAPQYTTGHDDRPSGALSFDGVDDYVELAQSTVLPAFNRPAYTIAMWVKGGPQPDRRVWSEGSSSSNTPLFTIGTGSSGSGAEVDIFIRYPSAGSPNHIISDGVAFDGTWHHIAWVDVGGNAALYIDGVRDIVDFDYARQTMALDRTAIGAVLRGGDCCWFDGEIDDAAMWDRALTTEEIEVLATGATLEGSIFDSFIATDVAADMDGVRSSIYARLPFQVGDVSAYEALSLRMRYDDGFIAYLNGVEVARRNAPAVPSWTSAATADREPVEAIAAETIPIPDGLGLLVDGENVLAVHGLNSSAGDGDFLLLPELLATGARSSSVRFMRPPTPGAPNGGGFVDFVADTRFSVDRGFFDAPFDVEITTETLLAEIRYTTDGSAPTRTQGTVYTGPLRIDGTTMLRAAAFRDGYEPTNVDTQTYIFLDDVIRQPTAIPGYPSSWAGLQADYAMDPQICTNSASPTYESTIKEDLTAIPAMSLVLSPDDFMGPSRGIYTHPESRGVGWERPGSMEYFAADGSVEPIQVNCGIRMQGGSSARPIEGKHSFRLVFSDRTGPTKLRYPMFPESDVEEFDTLVLRCCSTDSWHFKDGGARYRRWDSQYIRDVFMKDSQLAMGRLSGHNTYVHLWVNGLYWGLYNPSERPDDSFNAEHQGGDKDSWDVVKDFTESFRGNLTAWNAMMSLANGGLASDAAFQRIQGNNPDGTPNASFPNYLDVGNLVDYMILHFYGCSEDWPHHNWYAARDRTGLSGGFKFFVWDQEIVMDFQFRDRINVSNDNTPARLYSRLRSNAEFRMQFADAVQKHLFNDGALTIDAAQERWMQRARELDRAIVGESARWGDFRDDVPDPSNSPAELYTRDDHWVPERETILNSYIPDSHRLALQRFRANDLYPDVDPPEFVQHGGEIQPGFRLTMSAREGTIYYTLDGSDPRAVGGSVAPGAQVFGVGTVTTLLPSGAPARALVPTSDALGLSWTDPDFDDTTWRAGTTGVGFERTTGYEDLLGLDMGDVMDGINATVYIRVPFVVDDPADLDGLRLRMKYDDGFIAYLNGEEVTSRNAPESPTWDSQASAPNSDTDAVVFEDIDIAAFTDRLRAGANVLAIHGMNSSAGSSDVLLLPELTVSATAGSTVVLADTTRVKARARVGSEWSALQDTVFAVDHGLRITEIMYHPDVSKITGVYDQDEYEFIELQNTSDATLDLTGIRLVRGVEFDFAEGAVTTLFPGEVLVVVENLLAFESLYDTTGMLIAGQYQGKLSNSGEEIELWGPLDEVILRFPYSDDWYTETDGLGYSLVIDDPSGDRAGWGEKASWRSSADEFGSPGVDESGGPVGGLQRPGDANQDGGFDISDAVGMLLQLFGGAKGPLPCGASIDDPANVTLLDMNGDSGFNISDPVYLLDFLFRSGPDPVRGTNCIRIEGCPDACVR